MPNLKVAADAFVDALVDTGSKVAVTSFSSSSPGTGSNPTPFNLSPTPLTTANLSKPDNTGIKDSYRGLNSSGSTNWQDGLLKMQNFFPQFSGSAPDLVIMITDGNPNRINSAGGGTESATPDGSRKATNPAIAIANGMKTDGVHMFAIKVGTGNLNPIKAITYDTPYTSSPSNFRTADFMETTDYAALKADLESIAADLCGAQVTITKQEKTPASNDYQPASGWKFKTTVTSPDAAGKWVLPSTGAISQNFASTKEATTGADGTATFKWQPQGVNNTTPVLIEEDLTSKTDPYERDPLLKCTKSNIGLPGTFPFDVPLGPDGKWNLTTALGASLKPGDKVNCTAKNTLTQLKLAKTVVGGGSDPANWTLTAKDPQGATVYSGPGNQSSFKVVNGGIAYTLGEVAPQTTTPPGVQYDPSSWSCDGSAVLTGNVVTIPAGTETTCSITNTRTWRVTLTKKWDNGTAGDKVQLQIGGARTATNVSTAAGTSGVQTDTQNQASASNVPVGGNVTLNELFQVETGSYGTPAYTCTGVTLAPNAKTFTMPNNNVDCFVTNTNATKTVTLTKKWDNGTAGDKVQLQIGGARTATNVSTAAGTSGVQTDTQNQASASNVPVGGNVTLNELFQVETGSYGTPAYTCTGVTLAPNAKTFTMPNNNVDCFVTNTNATKTVTLTKKWDNGTAGDKVQLQIGGARTATNVSTAAGTSGVQTDTQNQASASNVPVGGNVTLNELFQVETGSYGTPAYTCTGVTLAPNAKTFTMPNNNVDCFVTNTNATKTVTLTKKWDNGTAGDKVQLQIGGARTATNVSTAAGTSGVQTDTQNQASASNVPVGGNVTLNELFQVETGSYGTPAYTCTGVTLAPNAKTFTMPNNNVDCFVTNTNATKTVTLQKEWVNGAKGDKVKLVITGGTNGEATSEANGDAGSWTDTQNKATATVGTGNTFSVDEQWLVKNGQYGTAEVQCKAGQTVLQPDNGKYKVEGADILCTITNRNATKTVSLQKEWVNGAKGDKVKLVITGGTNGEATSEANGDAGSWTDTQNKATATVGTGNTFSVDEQWLVKNGQYGTAEVQCKAGQTVLQPDNGKYKVEGADILCTITNRNATKTVSLQKEWVNGAKGDKVKLVITGGTNGETTSEANGDAGSWTDTQNKATATVGTGNTFSVDEQWLVKNGQYGTAEVQCKAGQTVLQPDNGKYKVEGADILCTITNRNATKTVSLQKEWVNGAKGDKVKLVITGGTNGEATSEANGDAGSWTDTQNKATATVGTGNTFSVDEQWLVKNGQYGTAEVQCKAGQTVLQPDNGKYKVEGADILCTITNRNATKTVSLQKEWVNGAKGDKVKLVITGGTNGEATSEANGDAGSWTDTQNKATATVGTGNTFSVDEQWLVKNGQYGTAEVQCKAGQTVLQPDNGKYKVEGADILCTITNRNATKTVSLQKEWVNGAKGDKVKLVITGGTNGEATSEANGDAGSWTDTQNKATATVGTGNTFSVDEQWLVKNGQYGTAEVQCKAGQTVLQPDNGKYKVEDADILCTITNTRSTAKITLEKQFVGPGDATKWELSAEPIDVPGQVKVSGQW